MRRTLFLTLPLLLLFSIQNLTAQSGQGQGRGRGGGGGRGEAREMDPTMGDPKEYLEDRMAELEEMLGLSGAQAVAVQALHQEFFEKLESARGSGGDRRAIRGAMMNLRDETDKEVLKLLSEEQAMKYEKFREQEKKDMQSRRRGR